MGEKKKINGGGEVLPGHEIVDTEVIKELGEKAFSLQDLAIAQYGMDRPLSHIEDGLNDSIVGQSAAIESLVTSLYRENLRNPNRPLAVLMFLGPTGVGKSETAKVLDKLLHGDRDTLLKIDCSNYSENHRVSALIGAAPEYVGREQKPILDKSKIEQPRSVILFDEIEKGAPKLFDLLLQIMEDGEVTLLNGGHKVSFRNSIIILTSNVGAKEMQSALNPLSLGFNQVHNQAKTRRDLESVAAKALKNSQFRPEFLNRIDEKIVFEPLNDDQIGQVLDLHVRNANKFYEKQGVHLTLTPELRNELVASTEERHEFGARPVLAKYRKLVECLMAKIYTTGGIPSGSDVYAMLADDPESSSTTIDQKIQLRYRPQTRLTSSHMTSKERAGKHRKNEESKEAENATDSLFRIKEKGSLALGAAAVGVAALLFNDYLNSRRATRTRRAC